MASCKRAVGERLGSGPFVANADLTLLDGCVAAGVLLALLVDLTLGLWWADALTAGLVGAVAVGQGVCRWREAG